MEWKLIFTKTTILANNFGDCQDRQSSQLQLEWYEVAQSVKIPVIGMGGITNGDDAVEFMLAGATAIMVGTANFVNPTACVDVLEGIQNYLSMYGINDVNDIIGILELN